MKTTVGIFSEVDRQLVQGADASGSGKWQRAVALVTDDMDAHQTVTSVRQHQER